MVTLQITQIPRVPTEFKSSRKPAGAAEPYYTTITQQEALNTIKAQANTNRCNCSGHLLLTENCDVRAAGTSIQRQ